MIQSKLKSAIWFLSRPRYLPQALQIAKYRIFPHGKENTRVEATEWCAEHAVTSKEAFARLQENMPYKNFRESESETYRQAVETAERCPVTMGGPGDLDLLYNLASLPQVKKVVETGVAYGWSSLAILAGLQSSEGRLISTDMPYLQMNNDQYVGCVVPQSWRENWKILRMADRQGLPAALGDFGTVDLCHYDSDKTYAGRIWAYALLWPALNPGGFFISDDINDNVAFSDFAGEKSLTPLVVKPNNPHQEKYVGILVKP